MTGSGNEQVCRSSFVVCGFATNYKQQTMHPIPRRQSLH
jgi:hypothetical protein